MKAVAVSLFILWTFSLWLLLIKKRRSLASLLPLEPFALTSGTVIFFVLSLVSLLFLRLLLTD